MNRLKYIAKTGLYIFILMYNFCFIFLRSLTMGMLGKTDPKLFDADNTIKVFVEEDTINHELNMYLSIGQQSVTLPIKAQHGLLHTFAEGINQLLNNSNILYAYVNGFKPLTVLSNNLMLMTYLRTPSILTSFKYIYWWTLPPLKVSTDQAKNVRYYHVL